MTLKAIGYARVSTSKQADKGHSLDLQLSALRAEAERHGWLFEGVTEEASARSLNRRPVLEAALKELQQGAASVLIVHRLDRLGRSVRDIVTLSDRATAEGWRLIFTEQAIDSSTATGRLTLGLLASVAQYDNELRSERIKEGLQEARAKGVRLGRRLELEQETAAYVSHLRCSGMTYREVSERLNEEAVPTARLAKWAPATVRQVLLSRSLPA